MCQLPINFQSFNAEFSAAERNTPLPRHFLVKCFLRLEVKQQKTDERLGLRCTKQGLNQDFLGTHVAARPTSTNLETQLGHKCTKQGLNQDLLGTHVVARPSSWNLAKTGTQLHKIGLNQDFLGHISRQGHPATPTYGISTFVCNLALRRLFAAFDNFFGGSSGSVSHLDFATSAAIDNFLGTSSGSESHLISSVSSCF